MSMRSILIATALSSVLAAATSAQAGEPGYYIGAGLGFVKPVGSTVTGVNSGKVDYNNSFMGSVSLGYQSSTPWRGEVELSRRGGNVDTVAGAAGFGETLATAIMVNALYDFDTGGSVTPYAGLGLGFASVKMSNVRSFGGTSYNDSDTALAYQGILGLSAPVHDGIDFFADYRYLGTQGLDFVSSAGNAGSASYKSHGVMVGLRFQLSPPPPAPAPVAEQPAPPAPMPAEPVMPALPRTYLVFFDWDKADITPEADAILRTAAANATDMGVVRLVLTGHADTSGPQGYNLGLSQRRADAVKAAFAKLGFKENEITTVAKGETEPLVATGDGVREPQNRRVEIVMP